MLDSAQCEFLLDNNNFKKISDFLSKKGFNNIRITSPQTAEDKGKIILLVTETISHDDYTVGRIRYDLRKLSVLGKSPHRKELTIKIEDNLKPLYKKRMTESAKPFTVESIQKIATQNNESFDVDIKEDESNEDVLVIRMNISIKRSCIEDKDGLIKSITQSAKEALESHLISNTLKRPFSQA